MTDGSDILVGKDGLIFVHMESLIEIGDVNSLILHWRDHLISEYMHTPQPDNMVDAVLRLSDKYQGLNTLENDILKVTDLSL